MQTPLQDALSNNAFAVLKIAPSMPAGELRRTMDHLRLEASLGLRDLDQDALASAEQVVLREPDCFEMRMFAAWQGDPVFAEWADEHDNVLSLVRSLKDDYGVDQALSAWLDLFAHQGLWAACAEFAPEGLRLGQFWGDVATEIARAATVGIDTAVSARLLEMTLSHKFVQRLEGTGVGIDPLGLLSLAISSVLSEVEEVRTRLSNSPRRVSDNELETNAALRLVDGFIAATQSVSELQSVVRRYPGPLGERGREAYREVALKLSALSERLSTALHNAGLFATAEEVLLETVKVDLGEAEREEVVDGLAIVRVAWAHEDFAQAMANREFVAAKNALNRIIQNSGDPEERQSARGLLERVAAAEHPPILRRAWNTMGGLAITALVIGGIVVLAQCQEEDPGSSSPVASGPTSRSATRDPRVGDCITTGTGASFIVNVVSCTSRNDGRIVAVGKISTNRYPSDAELRREASRICPSSADSYLFPTSEGWSAGDREMLCLQE